MDEPLVMWHELVRLLYVHFLELLLLTPRRKCCHGAKFRQKCTAIPDSLACTVVQVVVICQNLPVFRNRIYSSGREIDF